MKKHNSVSVIVPVYNVNAFLRRCVDSIIGQTYKNIEIILVDDGSTDKSGSICDEYKLIDKRVKVLHKKNGGLSDARNYGIEHSSGEYIIFVDSDDWLDENFVETYMNVVLEYSADLVIGKIKNTYNEKVVSYPLNNVINMSKKDAFKTMFLGDGTIISACAKLYARRIFNNCRYEYGKLYEDFLLFDKVIENSKSIYYMDYAGYFYYMRNGSIMRSDFDEKRMVLIDKSEYYIDYAKSNYPDLIDAAVRRYIVSCFNVLSCSATSKKYNNVSKSIKKRILKHRNKILHNKDYSSKEKYQTMLLMMGLPIYKSVLIGHQAIKNMRGR